MASIKTYYQDLRSFGIRYVWEYWVLGRFKGRKFKQSAVMRYLKKFYATNSIDSDGHYAVEPNPYPNSIWTCWWQGEEQMPEVVKICYESLKAHANGHPVQLITKDNYQQYVEMPEWIMEKFNAGIISVTHFSDLLRVALLSRYGGFWMDATLYLTGDMPKETPYFFTLKQNSTNEEYVSANRWSGYCIGGGIDNPIFSRTFYLLNVLYWKEHRRLINYYILDYMFDILYETNREIRNMIDENEFNNPEVQFLYEHLNREYNEKEWKQIRKNTFIHKLSWKENYSEYIDNKETYYYKIRHYGR